jgi:hypothetical protein
LSIFQAFEAYKRHMETGKAIESVADVPAPKKTLPSKTLAQKTPAPSTSKTTVDKPNPTLGKTISTAKPITIATADPKFYTIFLLAWPNKLDPNVGQLSLLTNVKVLNKEGKYHYYSGNYATKAEAEKVLPEIQNMGFKTAIIVQN